MKKTVLILFLLMTMRGLSQNYFISFAATGASITVETVTVENLTQCTSVDLTGSDILNLVDVVGINENTMLSSAMSHYPNPVTGSSCILYSAPDAGLATVTLLNAEGKITSIFSVVDPDKLTFCTKA